MNLTVQREALLEPLQMIIGVVERRQTLPILANVLIKAEGNTLSMTATDLEVELICSTQLSFPVSDPIELTVPAHKLLDICKTLPQESKVDIKAENERINIKSGRSRFVLSTLPATSFPCFESGEELFNHTLQRETLNTLLQRTHFAMGQQDVRYYLNGVLVEIQKGQLRAIATDGHRFAMNTAALDSLKQETTQAIVPRKGTLELIRLLKGESGDVQVSLGENHIKVAADAFTFTSKLIDGKFPDYEQVLPKETGKTISVDRDTLKEALLRVAILSNEKFRTIKLKLAQNLLHIFANNTDQEEAEENVATDYTGEGLEVAFNVAYLLDILNTVDAGPVKLSFVAPKNRLMVEEQVKGESVFLVMPLQL
jgi:DNA polymerase-3 subunit beta